MRFITFILILMSLIVVGATANIVRTEISGTGSLTQMMDIGGVRERTGGTGEYTYRSLSTTYDDENRNQEYQSSYSNNYTKAAFHNRYSIGVNNPSVGMQQQVSTWGLSAVMAESAIGSNPMALQTSLSVAGQGNINAHLFGTETRERVVGNEIYSISHPTWLTETFGYGNFSFNQAIEATAPAVQSTDWLHEGTIIPTGETSGNRSTGEIPPVNVVPPVQNETPEIECVNETLQMENGTYNETIITPGIFPVNNTTINETPFVNPYHILPECRPPSNETFSDGMGHTTTVFHPGNLDKPCYQSRIGAFQICNEDGTSCAGYVRNSGDTITDMTNQYRFVWEARQLVDDPRLQKVAQQRAQALADISAKTNKIYLDHNIPELGGAFQMLNNASIFFDTGGENMAVGYDNLSVINEWWREVCPECGHKLNMVNKDFKKTGVGMAQGYGGRYIVAIYTG